MVEYKQVPRKDGEFSNLHCTKCVTILLLGDENRLSIMVKSRDCLGVYPGSATYQLCDLREGI